MSEPKPYKEYFEKVIPGWTSMDDADRLASCLKLIIRKHPEEIAEILRLRDVASAYDPTPSDAGSMFNDWGDSEYKKAGELYAAPFIKVMELHQADVASRRGKANRPQKQHSIGAPKKDFV